jgi:hypothetical protein
MACQHSGSRFQVQIFNQLTVGQRLMQVLL